MGKWVKHRDWLLPLFFFFFFEKVKRGVGGERETLMSTESSVLIEEKK